jgi:hypothetical protein
MGFLTKRPLSESPLESGGACPDNRRTMANDISSGHAFKRALLNGNGRVLAPRGLRVSARGPPEPRGRRQSSPVHWVSADLSWSLQCKAIISSKLIARSESSPRELPVVPA